IVPQRQALAGGTQMRRRLFNIATALSLILCAAVCLLWIRSYWYTDRITQQRANGERSMRTRQGHLVVGSFVAEGSRVPSQACGFFYQSDLASPPNVDLLAILYIYPDARNRVIHWERGGFGYY